MTVQCMFGQQSKGYNGVYHIFTYNNYMLTIMYVDIMVIFVNINIILGLPELTT